MRDSRARSQVSYVMVVPLTLATAVPRVTDARPVSPDVSANTNTTTNARMMNHQMYLLTVPRIVCSTVPYSSECKGRR
jgi:hypothetical protein